MHREPESVTIAYPALAYAARVLGIAVCGVAIAFAFAPQNGRLAAAEWKAGAAQIAITPQRPMWMAGYSNRPKPATEKLHDLWAKALLIEDGEGNRAVLVTLDAIGIDRRFSLAVRDDLKESFGLERRQIAICSSHTHSGPVTSDRFPFVFGIDPRHDQLRLDYLDALHKKIVEVVGKAHEQLVPCSLAWGTGLATFAINRRNNVQADVPRLRAEGRLRGPVDYDVPVLCVRDGEGKLVATAFGYACHGTTLGPSNQKWSGDYAGYAQQFVEEAHPGCTALYWAGCGGDQNPGPRDSVALAEKHGRALADAVGEVIAGKTKPVKGELRTAYREIELPFLETPSRKEIEAQAAAKDVGMARRARFLLDQLDRGHELRPTYSYPVQTWRIGNELLLIALGGEAVVDYALEIKQLFGHERTFVMAYANDVMAYIPSRRVHREGEYEGRTGFMIYGLPAPWGPQIEPLILHAVGVQVDSLKPAPREGVDPLHIAFEDTGGVLPKDRWYVSGGANVARLRRGEFSFRESWTLSTAGNAGEPPLPLNVFQSGIDNTTSVAWGPAFRVRDSLPPGARIQFMLAGGSKPWNDSTMEGPSGLALWDVEARQFAKNPTGNVAYASSERNAFAFRPVSLSLEGLEGRRLCLALVDRATRGWGWSAIDEIIMPRDAIDWSEREHHRVTRINDFDDRDSLDDWAGDRMAFELGAANRGDRTALYINGHVRGVQREFPDAAGYLTSRPDGNVTSKGALRSPEFTLRGDILEFYLAGTPDSDAAVELVSADGKTLAVAKAAAASFAYDYWRIDPRWDGMQAYLRIIDRADAGYIEVDAVRMVEFDVAGSEQDLPPRDEPTPANEP